MISISSVKFGRGYSYKNNNGNKDYMRGNLERFFKT